MIPFVEKRDDQVFMTRGRGYAFPLHLHAHVELVYIDKGSLDITVGEQHRRLEAGQMAFICPYQIHNYDTPLNDNRITAAVISLALLRDYMNILHNHHLANPFLEQHLIHPNIPYALDQLYTEYKAQGRLEIYQPFIQLILARILEVSPLNANSGTEHQQTVWRIADYVNRHYHDNITLDKMAKDLNINKYRLSRLFSDIFGQNFPTYVNNLRLAYACNLLTGSDYSITNVSEESGFGSLRTFFRVFRNKYGMTPQAYRKQQNHQTTCNASNKIVPAE